MHHTVQRERRGARQARVVGANSSIGREGGAIAHVACAARRDLVKHRVLLSQTKMALVEPKGRALGFVLCRCLVALRRSSRPFTCPPPPEHVAGVDADMKLVEVLNVRLLEGWG